VLTEVLAAAVTQAASGKPSLLNAILDFSKPREHIVHLYLHDQRSHAPHPRAPQTTPPAGENPNQPPIQ